MDEIISAVYEESIEDFQVFKIEVTKSSDEIHTRINEVVSSMQLKRLFLRYSENWIDCILENMIFIEFDYEYSDIWCRLCEDDYSEKIVKLLNFMNRDNHVRTIFFNSITLLTI